MKRFILVALLAFAGSMAVQAYGDEPKPSAAEQAVIDKKADAAATEIVNQAKQQAEKAVLQQVMVEKAKLDKKIVEKQKEVDEKKVDAQLADALKITSDRLANLSVEEKQKLIDDLNHPDGKTLGQGVALFGKELGQGLAGAVTGAGTSFVEFASSGVGKIATVIIAWHFFGRQILWFIFICMLLKGLGKTVKSLFGEFNEAGKFVKLKLDATRNMGDGTIFGVYSIFVSILLICAIGAAVNF